MSSSSSLFNTIHSTTKHSSSSSSSKTFPSSTILPPPDTIGSFYLQKLRDSRSRLSLLRSTSTLSLPTPEECLLQDSCTLSPSFTTTTTTTTSTLQHTNYNLQLHDHHPTLLALVRDQASQVKVLDNAISDLNLAVHTIDQELYLTRSGSNWQDVHPVLDDISNPSVLDLVETRLDSDSNTSCSSSHCSEQPQYYGQQYYANDLFDIMFHTYEAQDAGNANLMILPTILPLPIVLTAFPQLPIIPKFQGGRDRSPPPRWTLPITRRESSPIPMTRCSSNTSIKPQNQANRPLINVNPEIIQFKEYEIGSIHQETFTIINISTESITVVLDLNSSLFTILPTTSSVRLAPGMHHRIMIAFRPDALCDFSACLHVNAYTTKGLHSVTNVCLLASRPPPVLYGWPTKLQLDCFMGSSVSQTFSVQNMGGPGEFVFGGEILGLLQVSPAFFSLPSRGIVNITVAYHDNNDDQEAPPPPTNLELACNNQASHTTIVSVRRVKSLLCIDPPIVDMESYTGMESQIIVKLTNPVCVPVHIQLLDPIVNITLPHSNRPGSSCSDDPDIHSPMAEVHVNPNKLTILPTSFNEVCVSVTGKSPCQIQAQIPITFIEPSTPLSHPSIILNATVQPVTIHISPPLIAVPGSLKIGSTHTTELTVVNQSTGNITIEWGLLDIDPKLLDCRISTQCSKYSPPTLLYPFQPRHFTFCIKAKWPGLSLGRLTCRQQVNDRDNICPYTVPIHVTSTNTQQLISLSPIDGIHFQHIALGQTSVRTIHLRNTDPFARTLYWSATVSAEAHSPNSTVFVLDPANGSIAPNSNVVVEVQCIPLRPYTHLCATINLCITNNDPCTIRDESQIKQCKYSLPVTSSCTVPRIQAVLVNNSLDTLWTGTNTGTFTTLELHNPTPVSCGFRLYAEFNDLVVDVELGAIWGYVPAYQMAQVDVYIHAGLEAVPQKFKVHVLVQGDYGSIVQHTDQTLLTNQTMLTITGKIKDPFLECNTQTIDFGQIPLFSWTVHDLQLRNPSTVDLEFSTSDPYMPTGQAWTNPPTVAKHEFKSLPQGTLTDSLKNLAMQAYGLASGQVPCSFKLVPPTMVVHAGTTVKVGIWCIGTQTHAHIVKQVIPIQVGNASLNLECSVQVTNSPLILTSPHITQPNTHMTICTNTSVPVHVTNIAPYPVQVYWGGISWTTDDMSLQDLTVTPPQMEIPAQGTRVIYVQHNPALKTLSPELTTNGILVHDLVNRSWLCALNNAIDYEQNREGVKGRIVKPTHVFGKRAMLQWASTNPTHAVYLSIRGIDRKDSAATF